MLRSDDTLWLALGLLWTVLIGGFAWHENSGQFQDVLHYASIEARASFDKDVLYRRWAASHGGVYVSVSEGTPPNPYLQHIPERDITTPSGRRLTLLNPAYMTRQVHELAPRSGVSSHITSLDPLRPENAADPWEHQALEKLESGQEQVEEILGEGSASTLRSIFPLSVEQGCLSCHASQGYRIGQIRGGISVSVPLAPYLAIYRAGIPMQVLYHAVIWLLGLGTLALFRQRIHRQFQMRDVALREAQTATAALQRQQTVFDTLQSLGKVGGWELDLKRGELNWTNEIYALFDLPRDARLNYQVFLDQLHPDDRDYVDSQWQAALDGAPYDIEHRLLIGGRTRWVREKAEVFFDAAGAPVAARGFTQDITERKREESVLAAQLRLIDYASDHSVDELLRRFLDEAESLTGSSIGFYHLVDADEKSLELHAWSSNTVSTMCKARPEATHYPIDQAGIWVDCVRQRRPVIHNDYAAHPHKKGLPEGHAPVLRELVVPVMRHDKIVAVLGVGNKPVDYDDEDLRTVQKLADLAWETVTRRRAELALADKETRYRQLFENMTSGFALHQMLYDETGAPGDYRFLQVNPAFEKLTGLKPERVVGRTVRELLPEVEQYWIDVYGEVAKTGVPKAFHNYSAPLSRHFETYAFSPAPNQFAVLFNDITEQREAEIALRESEERFQRLFRDHDAIMVLVEPESGAIVDANSSACRFYGYAEQRLKGMHIGMLNVAATETLNQARRQVLAGEQTTFEFRHRLANGEVRDVEVHSSLISQQGKTLIFSIIHDISERKILLEEYRRSAQLAALGTVAAGVAHEINNPLQGILTYAGLIERAPDRAERVAGLAQRIAREGERVAALTRNLLHYSRDTRGEFVEKNIGELIDDAIALVEVKLPRGEIRIERELTAGSLVMAVQPQGVQQIVVNLLDNACDALREVASRRPKVATVRGFVEQTATGEVFVLQVEDNGVGIPPAYLERVRDAFFSTKLAQQGTGLGLAIVGEIVDRHHGTMSIDSKEGSYTRVTVRIPRQMDAPRPPAAG